MNLVICGNLIVKNRRFLLVRETKKKAAGLYNLPAGQLEEGENIVVAAAREAKEETGLQVRPIKLISVFERPEADTNVVIFVFESRVISGKITTSKNHPEVGFFSLSEIRELQRKRLLRGGDYIPKVIQNWKRRQLYPINVIKSLK